jgi:serine/threonine-protein kinase
MSLVSITDPRLGTTIAGRYQVEDVIGEGGMATVYRARHKLVDRPCAIKIMNPTLARDRVVRERFRREAKAAQKLAHPNIIEIFDHGDTDDGTSYLVMELLRGESLADLIAKGPLTIVRAVPIVMQIARALARAHDFEVVHRDLKPENIFISVLPDGSELVKLLDFGIARSMHDTRLTGVGEVFGTPQYMAPERITSIDAGPPADLYALGIIFFEMLTGQLPFDAPDIPTFFVKHLKEPPPKIRRLVDVPESVERLLDRLLAKDAKQRPVDAHSVHADLAAIAAEVGAVIPPDPTTLGVVNLLAAPRTLPPVALDRWAHRTTVFEQMLTRAFGTASPPDLVKLLGRVKQLVGKVAEVRAEGVAEQRKLEAIEQKEREGRQRFGFAMDALGLDASAARQQARASQESIVQIQGQIEQIATGSKEAFREMTFWEGRFAFREPSRQLSAAYRAAADVIDHWYELRQQEKSIQGQSEERERMVADLDYQIRELRAAMANFEQSVGAEKAAQQGIITELGQRGDALDAELVNLASLFCAPLRSRPELGAFFKELEGDAQAA